MISTSVRRYDSLALWLIVLFSYYINFSFLQQVDRFRELYLTEQEQKLDVESELKDCKVKNFYFFFSSLLSFLSAYI
jgi:hypothetical protein